MITAAFYLSAIVGAAITLRRLWIEYLRDRADVLDALITVSVFALAMINAFADLLAVLRGLVA